MDTPFLSFLKSLDTGRNSTLIEAVMSGYFTLYESTSDSITLYRGLESAYDPDYDLSNTDAPNGYSTWSDSLELAKQYAGPNGYVYSITLPLSELGNEYITPDGERTLFFNNEKAAGLNGVSGNEYLVYNEHELFNPNMIQCVIDPRK